jgi:hypothetical protein
MYDEELTNLDEWLRRLKTEYQIFFAGNRKKPPDDLRLRVEKLVKKLSECSELSFSQRFRFNTLVSRFYVHRDLWRRTLSEREIGTQSKVEATPKTRVSPNSTKSSVEAIRVSISDPKSEEEKVQLLYETLLRVRKAETGDTPIPYPQFAKYIAAQTRGIREKFGCSKVAFTIALEENTIRFTAAADSR